MTVRYNNDIRVTPFSLIKSVVFRQINKLALLYILLCPKLHPLFELYSLYLT